MNPPANEVSVWVQGREYRLAHEENEAQGARAAADLLNQRLKDLCGDATPKSQEEPLLLAALALVEELETCKSDCVRLRDGLRQRLDQLRDKLAKALDEAP